MIGCTASVEARGAGYQLVLKEVKPFAELDERDAQAVHIRLNHGAITEEALYTLRGDLGDFSGNSDLYLHVGGSPAEEVVVRVSAQLRVSSRAQRLTQLRQLPLVQEVWKS